MGKKNKIDDMDEPRMKERQLTRLRHTHIHTHARGEEFPAYSCLSLLSRLLSGTHQTHIYKCAGTTSCQAYLLTVKVCLTIAADGSQRTLLSIRAEEGERG